MPEPLDRTIGRLETKVDHLISLNEQGRKSHERLAARLSVLERWRYWVAGAAYVALGISGLVSAIVLRYLDQMLQ